MGDTDEHDSRSPSGGDWWGNCPGAPALCEKLGLKSTTSPAAEWGTMAHGWAEKAANFILGRAPKPVIWPPDKKLVECLDFYTNALFASDESVFEDPHCQLCDCKPKSWQWGIEHKGGIPHLPYSKGTKDAVSYCPVHRWLRVSDLKTGYGEVEARDNIQCAIYGLHELLSKKTWCVDRVVIEIIQPFAPSGIRVKRWALTPLELLEWLPVVQRKVAASMHPNAPLVAGDKQCRFCPANAVCLERKKLLTAVAVKQFGIAPPASFTPEDVAWALDKREELRDWIKAVDSLAYQLASNGVKIPGYKLVQGRDGNRKWADEEATRKHLLNAYHLATDVTFEPAVLKSPADIEDILKKVGQKAKDAKEVVDSQCTRKPGEEKLVPVSHKGEEIHKDKTATFAGMIDRNRS